MLVVHHAGACIEPHGHKCTHGLVFIKPDLRLGFGQPFAEQARQSLPVTQGFDDSLGRKFLQRFRHLGRRVGGRLFAVAVKRDLRVIEFGFEQTLQHLARHLKVIWCAKPNGASDALTIGHAVVGPTWGQIKHVACVQRHLLFGLEVGQYFQWHIGLQDGIFHAADLPAAFALHLQQKNVVRIKVRPHATAVAGIRHHQIV